MINLLDNNNNNNNNNNNINNMNLKEENDYIENIINSLKLDIDKIEKEIEILYNNQDNEGIEDESNQYKKDVESVSFSILQNFDSSTISFEEDENNYNNNDENSNNYNNNNNNINNNQENNNKLIEIQLLNKIFDINKAFNNKKNNINKIIKENESKCENCILKSKGTNNNNNTNNINNSNKKNSNTNSTNVTIGSIRDLNKIQPLTVNEFTEWRSLIDDEVFDLYYLVKELKSKIPSNNNNSTDSPASPILSGKTRNKDLYLYNNTFTNILQLKNDLVNIIQDPFFNQNNTNKNNKNKIKNEINNNINDDTLIIASNTSVKVTDLSDNNNNNDNNNNSNSNTIGGGGGGSNDTAAMSSKSAPNSPNSRRKNIKQASSPNLSPPGSPLRNRANSAERSPSLSSLPTAINNNNNNSNNNSNNINNNATNTIDSNINSLTPNKQQQTQQQPIINKPIQKVQNKILNSPSGNNNIVVASPNKTTNYYYKLTELDQEKCEDEIKAWIQNILGIQLCEVGPHLPNSSPLSHHLRSGVILCQVINQLRPNSIKKINLAPTPFYQMENIAQFLRVCEGCGVDKRDLFHSLDLYEMRNMKSVVATIHALAKSTQRLDDLKNSIYLYSSFNQNQPLQQQQQQTPTTPTKK